MLLNIVNITAARRRFPHDCCRRRLMSDQTPVKVSAVEGIKEQRRYLAGDIGPELSDGLEHFGKSSETLLKFHGTYQQDDRDERGTGGLDAEGKKKKSYI